MRLAIAFRLARTPASLSTAARLGGQGGGHGGATGPVPRGVNSARDMGFFLVAKPVRPTLGQSLPHPPSCASPLGTQNRQPRWRPSPLAMPTPDAPNPTN